MEWQEKDRRQEVWSLEIHVNCQPGAGCVPQQIHFHFKFFIQMIQCLFWGFNYSFNQWSWPVLEESQRSLDGYRQCMTLVWDVIPITMSFCSVLANLHKVRSNTACSEDHWRNLILSFQMLHYTFLLSTVALNAENAFLVIKCVQKRYYIIFLFSLAFTKTH